MEEADWLCGAHLLWKGKAVNKGLLEWTAPRKLSQQCFTRGLSCFQQSNQQLQVPGGALAGLERKETDDPMAENTSTPGALFQEEAASRNQEG